MWPYFTSEVYTTKLALSRIPIDYGFSHYTYLLLKGLYIQSLPLPCSLNHICSTPYSEDW